MSHHTAPARTHFRHFESITTRWADNDAYGHVNNAVYYQWFDVAVNGLLIRSGLLNVLNSPCIGLVVETGCNYFSPLHYPQGVQVGLRVAKLGGSSVRYELGVFAEGAENAAACGHFVHVYVDRTSRKSVPVPLETRIFLETLI